MKYPETPRVHIRNEKDGRYIQINYNGLRLEISPVQSNLRENGKTHSVTFAGIEEKLGEKPALTSFEVFKNREQYQKDCSRLKKINLRAGGARRYAIKVVTAYATWFGDAEKRRLDDLIRKYIEPEPVSEAPNPALAFTPERERDRFFNIFHGHEE